VPKWVSCRRTGFFVRLEGLKKSLDHVHKKKTLNRDRCGWQSRLTHI
jgi:hypothetical protein